MHQLQPVDLGGAISRPQLQSTPHVGGRAEIRSYAIGFVASLVLTGGAFAAHLSGLSASWKIALICAAALVQIVKVTKIPIVCIANDRGNRKLQTLLNH